MVSPCLAVRFSFSRIVLVLALMTSMCGADYPQEPSCSGGTCGVFYRSEVIELEPIIQEGDTFLGVPHYVDLNVMCCAPTCTAEASWQATSTKVGTWGGEFSVALKLALPWEVSPGFKLTSGGSESVQVQAGTKGTCSSTTKCVKHVGAVGPGMRDKMRTDRYEKRCYNLDGTPCKDPMTWGVSANATYLHTSAYNQVFCNKPMTNAEKSEHCNCQCD